MFLNLKLKFLIKTLNNLNFLAIMHVTTEEALIFLLSPYKKKVLMFCGIH
jgi:hypothetical protein